MHFTCNVSSTLSYLVIITDIYTARQSTLVQSTLMQSDLEQQLKQELSDKNMIISRKQVELSNVVGQGKINGISSNFISCLR